MATMISPLRRAVQVGAPRTAVSCKGVDLSYRETWDRCQRLVGGLRGLGVEAGDRVAWSGRTAIATSSCTRRCPARAWSSCH